MNKDYKQNQMIGPVEAVGGAYLWNIYNQTCWGSTAGSSRLTEVIHQSESEVNQIHQ